MSNELSYDDINYTEDALRSSTTGGDLAAYKEPSISDKEYLVQVFEFYSNVRDMLKVKLHKTYEETERLLEDNLHVSASLAKDLTESDHHATVIMEKYQSFYDELAHALKVNLNLTQNDDARKLLVQEVSEC